MEGRKKLHEGAEICRKNLQFWVKSGRKNLQVYLLVAGLLDVVGFFFEAGAEGVFFAVAVFAIGGLVEVGA